MIRDKGCVEQRERDDALSSLKVRGSSSLMPFLSRDQTCDHSRLGVP